MKCLNFYIVKMDCIVFTMRKAIAQAVTKEGLE